jgi:Domain of unknown function (DUF222)
MSGPGRPDEDPDRDFADRGVKLATTFGGAGVIHGDLTAECAAIVGQVLDALGAKAGKEDDRTRDQRYHDALAEAMRRLVAAGLLPERAGQPVKAWVHMSLADLMLLDGDSALQEQWTAQIRERWAARRAFASETGSEGGAWLDGDAAEAITCDAAMAPLVTGDVNVAALEDLVRLCVELDRLRRAGGEDAASGPGGPGTDTTAAWAAIEQAVIGKAVDLGAAQGGEVLADVGLGDVGSGHQEADHERSVEDLAEPEGLRDVQRDPEQGGRGHLPVKERVEPLVGRTLEGEGDLLRREHGLQGLHGGEVAAGVVAHPHRHPGQVRGPAHRGLGRHHDGAGSHRIGGGDEAAGPLSRGGVGGPVAGAADVGAAAPGPEGLEGTGLDLPGRDPVVTFGQEGVLEPFGGEVALFLRDPLLQPAVRQDLQRHRVLPASVHQL